LSSLDWNSQVSIRDCWLIGLPDLNQKNKRVSDAQIELLNRMINYGVGGFRIDAAKVKHFIFEKTRLI
jgi:alpha-amylase